MCCKRRVLLDCSGAEWDVVGRWGGIGVFNGRFDHAIDEKGRVSIPARFRDILQRDGHDRMYITNFIFEREKLLELYPPAEWERMVAKFADRRTGDRAAKLFEIFYIGGAH